MDFMYLSTFSCVSLITSVKLNCGNRRANSINSRVPLYSFNEESINTFCVQRLPWVWDAICSQTLAAGR